MNLIDNYEGEETRSFEIADLVILSVVTLIYIAILIWHMYKKDYFPIKERSAWLTLTLGISNYICLGILLTVYFNNQNCISF